MVELNVEIDRDAYIDSVFHSVNFGGSTQLGLDKRWSIYSIIEEVLDPTHFVDSLLTGPDDYINGAWFMDLSRGAGSYISDFDALTHTVSLVDPIPRMHSNDDYWIDLWKEKVPFLHWPIDAIPPGSTINSAILNMYVAVAKPYLNNGIYTVSGEDWGEYTLTWDDRPSGSGGTDGVISADEVGWKTGSVLEPVQLWYLYPDLAPNYGIRIDANYNGSEEIGAAYFYSRESAFKPFVIINYTPPALIRGTSWIID